MLVENSGKPLKINRDLLLFRSRELRRKSKKCADRAKKMKYLQDAEVIARQVLELDPQDPRCYVTLGNILLLQDRIDEAAKVYEEGCVVTEGKNAFIWSSWGYLEGLKGNQGNARKYFEAATTADSTHAAAWHGWSVIEKSQGNYLRARNLLQKGIQEAKQYRKPCSPYLFQSLGVLAFEMGLFQEARKWLSEGVRTGQGDQSIAMWHTWALLESQLGEDYLTDKLFFKAYSLSSRSRYVLLSWGLWELQRGNVDKAKALFRDGCESNPADVPLLQAYALLEARTGEADSARHLFQKAQLLDPKHIPALQARALFEFQQGCYEESREMFKIALERAKKTSDQVFCYQAWGCVENKLGNYAFARELFKNALRIDPQNAASWGAWIRMEEDLGLLNRAQEIRLLRTQQRVDVPQDFTTRQESQLQPVLNTISNWFNPLSKEDRYYGDQQSEDDILKQIMQLNEEEKDPTED